MDRIVLSSAPWFGGQPRAAHRLPPDMASGNQERVILTESEVCWIRRLLAKGVSYRRIQEITGAARDTIGKIARQERPDYERLRRGKQQKAEALERTRRPIRCKCGHWVYPPCRICRIRKALADGTLRQVFRDAGFDRPIGLELRPEHQKRYEQVRARRMRRKRRKRDR